LIYHSSCKVPGVAGTAEVVSAPYPDPAQFDPESPYFDPKSPADHPRWFCVDIRHRQTFADVIPAGRLKAMAELADMPGAVPPGATFGTAGQPTGVGGHSRPCGLGEPRR